MKHSLWGDGSGLDEAMASYTAGDDRRWDQRLLRWDIIGTMGHIRGLAEAGLLTTEDHTALAANNGKRIKRNIWCDCLSRTGYEDCTKFRNV